MDKKDKSKCGSVLLMNYSAMTILAGILIAVYPILAPYTLFGINLRWILGIIFVLSHFLARTTFPIMSSTKSLTIYTLLSMFLSLNGLFVLRDTSHLINADIAMALDLLIYMMLWYYSDIDVVMKCANTCGYICCIFAFIQVVALLIGSDIPSGRLPFFEPPASWIPEVWGFRFNSLFSEPSYFAIYLLPIFLYNFMKNDWKNTIIFAIFIVLSSSSLGIISMTIVLLVRFISSDFSSRNKFKLVVAFLCTVVLANVVMSTVPAVKSFIFRSFKKIEEIFKSTSNGGFMKDIRLGGYLNLFAELPVKEQLLGVGNAQLQNYFAERGVFVSNYSNSFVLSLLNFGLIGFITFLIFLWNLFCISLKNKTFLFWLILILILGVDSLLFSYRYYWLVYFVLFSNKRMEKKS